MESPLATGKSVHTLLQWISKANEDGHCWKFNPDVGEVMVDTGAVLCDCLKLDALAKEGGARLWNNALWHENLEHEREGWFDGRKAKALFNVFHDSWNHLKRGDEDQVGNAGAISSEFKWSEAGNWGLAVDDSNGEMIVGLERNVKHGSCRIAMEAANEMPILRRCRKSALTILAAQLCQIEEHGGFPSVLLPGEAWEAEMACQIASILLFCNGLCVDLQLLVHWLMPDLHARIAAMALGNAVRNGPNMKMSKLQHSVKWSWR